MACGWAPAGCGCAWWLIPPAPEARAACAGGERAADNALQRSNPPPRMHVASVHVKVPPGSPAAAWAACAGSRRAAGSAPQRWTARPSWTCPGSPPRPQCRPACSRCAGPQSPLRPDPTGCTQQRLQRCPSLQSVSVCAHRSSTLTLAQRCVRTRRALGPPLRRCAIGPSKQVLKNPPGSAVLLQQLSRAPMHSSKQARAVPAGQGTGTWSWP